MARKKAEIPVDAAIPPSPLGAPAAIACPACKSKISADGKTLHEKSSYLDELIETDASVDEVEKKIEKMQKAIAAHEATIADLRAQLEATKTKTPLTTHLDAPKKKEKPRVVQTEKSGSGRPSWWD
jgi:septal ring factor EnvC (AmiA/AmiB activator)